MAVALRKILNCTTCGRFAGPTAVYKRGPEVFPLFSSVFVIQSRHKISKTSPFGKRSNPMNQQRKQVMDTLPNPGIGSRGVPSQQHAVVDSTGTIISRYVPLEKKAFLLTPTGLKQRWEAFRMGLWTVYSLAFIKKYSKPFKLKEFAEQAQNMYIEVNKALESRDKKTLQELCTGSVYHSLRKEFGSADKYLHWRFVSSVERPRVVHCRVAPVDTKDNLFAQVTVKLNTEQVMAMKDQYGRHIKGSDKKVKKVKDYVVFERHIVNKYGRWKVCGKVFHRQDAQPQRVQQLTQQPAGM